MRLMSGMMTGCLSVTWAASGGWSACHAADVPRDALLACAKLSDTGERLTCYDRLTQQLSADPSAAIPSAAAPADLFGSRPRSEPAASPKVARTELKSITARVVSLRERHQGGALLTLDNGQQWLQLGSEDLVLKVGDGVKISRGMFDSFILMTDGNRTAPVKRIE